MHTRVPFQLILPILTELRFMTFQRINKLIDKKIRKGPSLSRNTKLEMSLVPIQKTSSDKLKMAVNLSSLIKSFIV